MTFIDRISKDIAAAMKAKETTRLGALRMAKAALMNQEVQKGRPLDEAESLAAEIGLSYPFGPLEWGDRLGPKRIRFILQRLHAFYGEPRYRPSPWLMRRAALGLSLLAPDRRA